MGFADRRIACDCVSARAISLWLGGGGGGGGAINSSGHAGAKHNPKDLDDFTIFCALCVPFSFLFPSISLVFTPEKPSARRARRIPFVPHSISAAFYDDSRRAARPVSFVFPSISLVAQAAKTSSALRAPFRLCSL